MTTDITELAQRNELLIANGQQTADLLRHLADNEIDSDYFAVVSECENYGKETDAELSITEFALRAAGYVDALVEALEKANRYIEELREWNAGLAQESCERQQRISELLECKVGNALLERENHHVEVVGKLTKVITELESEVEKWKQEAETWEQVAEKQLAIAIELESRTFTVENLQESAYRAGLTAGWNLGLANNNDGFNKCLAAHAAGIKVEAE
ncbi:hypothetical protein RSM42_002190 [Klebsiella pneumoniae]|nr:hypothetical protein [Klebsiella pneumoniae]